MLGRVGLCLCGLPEFGCVYTVICFGLCSTIFCVGLFIQFICVELFLWGLAVL